MATLSELEKQIADLDSKLKYGVGNRLRERNEALEFTRQLIQKAEAAGDEAKVERETRILGNILQEVSDLNGQVSAIQSQKDQLQQELNILKTQQQSQQAQQQSQQNTAQSAGEEVKQSGDAGATNPPQPTEAFSPEGRIKGGTNAEVPVTRGNPAGEDAGTDANTVPLSQSQSVTYAPGTGEPLLDRDAAAKQGIFATPSPYGPGVGQPGDDKQGSGKNATKQDIDLSFDQIITPQPNILDAYASYTYQISWYLLSEWGYRDLMTSGSNNRKVDAINGAELLVQSGGAGYSTNPGQTTATVNGVIGLAGDRNKYFKLDYYIDSCTVDNLLQGKATGTASSYTSLKMTVVEPNGISLIDNLKAAVSDFTQQRNFTNAIYCLVIKFRGYDENGNPVLAGNTGAGADLSDPYTISIKYVPFAIADIKFSVGSKMSTYEIHGQPIIYNFRLRNTIPNNIELTGETVNEILGGQLVTSSNEQGLRNNTTSQAAGGRTVTPAPRGQSFPLQDQTINTTQQSAQMSVDSPSKINAAPKGSKSTVRGLMDFLNENQRKLVEKKEYLVADEYQIEFVNASIRDATLKKPGDVSIGFTPMDNSADTRKILDETTKMVPSQRNFGITAGMSIVQAIEMIVRQSSFITEQQLKYVDERTQQFKDNGPAADHFAWFKISMRAIPKDFDFNRNDNAYKFIFTVSAYNVKSLTSNYFPKSRFNGVHKSYPYWFTGQNTAVLDYTQKFDNLYRVVISGNTDQLKQNLVTQYGDLQQTFVYQPLSGQSSQGATGATNEPAANAADYLYSPTDIGTVKIKILGDPGWIAQGEVFKGNDARTFSFKAFYPDGTINFDAQEILFEIVWQRPVDYDVNGDGTMNPNRQDPNNPEDGFKFVRNGRQSYVFCATKVSSEFRQGRFEQSLDGILYVLPRPKISQQVVDRPVTLATQTFPLSSDQRVKPATGKQNNTTRTTTVPASAAQSNNRMPTAPATGTQFTGQGSNLTNQSGMDFSPISGFGA
jgi:hypothetical protein